MFVILCNIILISKKISIILEIIRTSIYVNYNECTKFKKNVKKLLNLTFNLKNVQLFYKQNIISFFFYLKNRSIAYLNEMT